MQTIACPAVNRSFSDYAALTIAAAGGIGYIPFFPATWGSLLGVGVFFSAQYLINIFIAYINPAPDLLNASHYVLSVLFLIVLFLIGIRSATYVEKLTEKKDPKIVVIDEIVGQYITLLLIPATFDRWTIPAAFFAFRLFDIWKLYPADRLEKLPSGMGIMADDIAAAVYAAALIRLVYHFYLAIF